MGTMVGDDGDRARTRSAWRRTRVDRRQGLRGEPCSDPSLLASAQWMLAPTDLNGANPQPALPAHHQQLVGQRRRRRTWYRATPQAWVAAGIFAVFSNGNAGPGCGTTGSPGDYAESFGVGGFQENGAVYALEPRPAASRQPDQAATLRTRRQRPLVGRQRRATHFNGTSMAAPHVSGRGCVDVVGGASLVARHRADADPSRQTAVDTCDVTCGGTPADNNV